MALRRLLETTLPDAGYTVQAVVEAQAAIEAVTQQPPDAVLLDVMLPGIDGFGLCQILEEVWGATYSDEHHYLWVHIAHLRQKIEPDSKQPRYILTERGVGYRLAKE